MNSLKLKSPKSLAEAKLKDVILNALHRAPVAVSLAIIVFASFYHFLAVIINPATSSASTVSQVAPNSGPAAGGTSVEITGSGFTTNANAVKIASGIYQSFYINSSGSLGGWGWGGWCQLGDVNCKNASRPISIMPSVSFYKVAAGSYHTVAIDTDGNLWSWGYGNYGQLGNGIAGASAPSQIMLGTEFMDVIAGQDHSLAIDTDGNLWSWGRNNYGQLGDGTRVDRDTPVQIMPGTVFVSVGAGYDHSFALDDSGNLWAWGNNNVNQLGDGTTTERRAPVQILSGVNFKSLAGGGNFSVALDDSGNLWAWGNNSYGQHGDSTNTTKSIPTQITTGLTFSQIVAGFYHVLAIDTDGNLWSWGRNNQSQLGDNTNTSSNVPISTMSGTKFTQVSAGYYHSVAIGLDGSLWTWGSNSFSVLGSGSTDNKLIKKTPSTIIVPAIASVAFGDVKADYFLVNSDASITATSPPHVSGLVDIVLRDAAGEQTIVPSSFEYHRSFATTSVTPEEGSVDGGTPIVISGVDFDDGVNIVKVASGGKHTLAIDDGGNLYAWGYDNSGQVGDGTVAKGHYGANALAPIKLTGLDTSATNPLYVNALKDAKIVDIAAGNDHSMAIDDQGNLYMWGADNTGQIGDGSITGNHSSSSVLAPIKLTGLDTGPNYDNQLKDAKIVGISAGYYNSMAIDDQGNLYVWGSDNTGQIGDGALDLNRSGNQAWAPVKLTGLDTTVGSPSYVNALKDAKITKVASGREYSMAIDDQGNLYAWGSDATGQIGDGALTANHYSTAVRAPIKLTGLDTGPSYDNQLKDAKIVDIASRYYHSIALDDRGNVYTWGYNSAGQLGNGTTSNLLAPSRLTGKDTGTYTNELTNEVKVISISAGDSYSMAVDIDGNLYAWGSDAAGQIGDGDLALNADGTNTMAPIKLTGLDTGPSYDNQLKDAVMMSVSTGATFATAIDSVGNLYVWGDDLYGQTGNGELTINKSGNNILAPIMLSALDTGTTYENALRTKYSVDLGGSLCSDVLLVSSTEITCTTTAHVAAIVDVTVTASDGQTATLSQSYEYLAPYYITLALDKSTATINATPTASGHLDTDKIVVTTDTNSAAGYYLTVEQGATGNSLVCSENSAYSYSATSVDNSATVDANSWGIGVGSDMAIPSNWRRVSNSPITLNSSLVAGIFNTYLYYGANTNYSQAPCQSYTGTVVLTAITN